MEQVFRVVYWQHLAEGKIDPSYLDDGLSSSAFNRSVSLSLSGPSSQFKKSDVFIEFDHYNQLLSNQYHDIHRNTPEFHAGLFSFCGWTQLGSCGLILNEQSGICLIGDILGWGVDFAKWYSELELQAKWADDLSEVRIDLAKLPVVESPGIATSLLAPGQDIYGHWLLDYIPRIFAMEDQATFQFPVRMASSKQWMVDLLAILGLNHRVYQFNEKSAYIRYETLRLPSFLKRGYIIHESMCADAWSKFRDCAKRIISISQDQHQKIFVSRYRFVGARALANALEIQELVVRYGYKVIYPEEMSIAEQISAFRSAKVVIGPDGSGLHSVVFSESLVALGVIGSSQRINFWHSSICSALGARIAYIQAESKNGQDSVALDSVELLLKELDVLL